VPFQERRGVLGGKRHLKTVVRLRQIQAQEMCLLFHARNHHQRFTEVSLSVPGRMHQRHENFLVPHARFPHVVLHHGVAAAEAVLRL